VNAAVGEPLQHAHLAHDLSPRQFHLLGLLHDRGAMTQRELGALMDVDPSILVTLLNRLEADGYLVVPVRGSANAVDR